MYVSTAASMVVEPARSLGRVKFVLGVTSYLGRAWLGFGAACALLHGGMYNEMRGEFTEYFFYFTLSRYLGFTTDFYLELILLFCVTNIR